MESRNNKKRCMGRVTKNLADLTLQSGLVAESLTLYYSAAETLKAVNDWLWLAAAKEGNDIFYYRCKKRGTHLKHLFSVSLLPAAYINSERKSTHGIIIIYQSSCLYIFFLFYLFQASVQHQPYFSTQTFETQRPYKETPVYKRTLQTKPNRYPCTAQTLTPSGNSKSHHPLSEPRKRQAQLMLN